MDLRSQLDSTITAMRHSGLTCAECVAEFKKQWIISTLRAHRGNQCKAARELNIHRNTMSRTIRDLRIDVQALRSPKPQRRPAQSSGGYRGSIAL